VTILTLKHVDLVQNDVVESEAPRAGRVTRRLTRLVALVRNIPHLGTWTGVLLSASGLLLVVVAWGRTAGLTNVALQVPYVVSAGFTGLGLVAVGLTVVNISAKQADAKERTRQVAELRDLLTELRQVVTQETTGEEEQ
jgi:hypothetical protein